EVHKNAFYCLGWIYMEHSPYPVILHNGATLMKTMIAYVPEQKIGIVILSNYVTDLPELLALRFIDLYAGKAVKDISAEALAELEKIKKQAKSAEPVKPKQPSAAMPLAKYAGDYANDVYGKINVHVADGRLTVVMGLGNVRMALDHWDKDTFAINLISPLYDCGLVPGFAVFQVDPEGKVKTVTIDPLNQDDNLGVFKRVEKDAAK
ncbi:MAG: DUF3471 domain-containing protein, partial [Syntrophobacter sp.]